MHRVRNAWVREDKGTVYLEAKLSCSFCISWWYHFCVSSACYLVISCD